MMINNKLVSVVLLLLAGNVFAEINYGDLPTDLLPPTKWESISSTWEDPGNWIAINVNEHGLPANNSSIDASDVVEDIVANTHGNRIMYFSEGKYWFKTTCRITNSNIGRKL